MCKKCNCFYIGESSRMVKDRLKEHLNNINKHIPFDINQYLTVVANHFNLVNHNVQQHFRFFIYTKNLEENDLKLMEAKLIYIFQNIYYAKLLNNKFPSPYKIILES